MPLIDELSKAQRIVVVIALGLALGVTGTYLVGLGTGTGTGFGWYAYAPLTTAVRPAGSGLAAWLRLIIWLVLIGMWALAAIRVLRPAAGGGRPG